MTHLGSALTQATSFEIETNERLIRRLRADAKQQLDAASGDHDDLMTVCRLILDILTLQDRINQDRHRISISSQTK
jgi:hypothetical protein